MVSNVFMKSVFLLLSTVAAVTAQKNQLNQDDSKYKYTEKFTTEEHIRGYGYPSETHHVVTDDGYILKVYRIPYGLECGPKKQPKVPVVMWHGLLANSIDFLLNGPNDSIGFMFADACFDVWLPNSRGNFESRKHLVLNPNYSQFWRFSWHEMGAYDLPAVIDYVLRISNSSSLHYIGHSQGTTIFFVYASLYPRTAAQKVTTMHALAPVAFVKHVRCPWCRLLSKGPHYQQLFADIVGWNEFLPPSNLIELIGGTLCKVQHPNITAICDNTIFLIAGFDSRHFNSEIVPNITVHDPAGIATRQLLHFGQGMKSGYFRPYDYGPSGNLLIYRSIEPPDYPIQRIRVPVYLYTAEDDWLVSYEDTELLKNRMQSIVSHHNVGDTNHLGFLWSRDVKTRVNDVILKKIQHRNC